MNTIKGFNQKINNSYDPNKSYKLWENYRKQVSVFLSSIDFSNKSVLVIASGHLNDLDLSLLKPSKHLTFLDIDIENTRLGYKRQGIDIPHTLLELDLTNLTQTTFLKDFKEGSTNAKEMILEKYQTFHKSFPIEKYDVIILLPVYTQLLLPQLLPMVNSQTLQNKLMTFIGFRIQILNQNIKEHLNKNGSLIVLSDMIEYQTTSEECAYLKAHQNNTILLEDHTQNYIANYGHTLGSFGLLDINSEMKKLKETLLVWPFNQDKILIVKGQIMTNK